MTINPIITIFSDMFRSNYAGQVDIVNTPIAIHHDAIHALVGLGISGNDEADVQTIETYLRGGVQHADDKDKALYLVKCMPAMALEALKDFYSNN